MEAHAIVGVDDAIVAAYGAQLIASVLVASGVVFVVSGAANDVGRHIYDTMASSSTFKAAFSKISSLALWFVQHPADITGAALRISDELAGPIIQCFQSRCLLASMFLVIICLVRLLGLILLLVLRVI